VRRLVGWSTVLVLLVLAMLEIFSRAVLVGSSKDLRRFREYPAVARALGAAPARRVALIGNSATDRGVDPALLSRELTARVGTGVEARKLVADASRINDWYYILNRFFWQPGVAADLYVVTFYEDDLEDGNRIEIGRLAQFFTTARDWPSVFALDLPTVGDRLDFVMSSAWMTFAVRSRIRERVLEAAVPHYKTFVAATNDANIRHLKRRAPAAAPRVHSYGALERLLGAAAAHGSRIVFVAYPTAPVPDSEPYVVDPATVARVTGAGMQLLDMRGRVPDIQPRHYEDDVHLNPEGAALYTRRLAEALAPRL